MAGFLLVAGLTGSLLAWLDELEVWIAPQALLAAPPHEGAQPLDPLALQQAVLAQLPANARLPWVRLYAEPGRTVRFGVATVDGQALPYDDVHADPYTGQIRDKRRWGDLSEGPKNAMTFVYRLHYSLALDRVGAVLMGIVALAWTLDCFVGAWLTLPLRLGVQGKKSWWARWWPAWRLRWRSGPHKLNFDLHRAGGLWTWAMLFVLAWSSVAFNLKEVYNPVTAYLLGGQTTRPDRSHLSALPTPRTAPAMAPRQALERARSLMAQEAARRHVVVRQEDWLGYEPTQGVYIYIVTTDRDIRQRYGGETRLFFDGNSGALRGLYLPTGESAGDTVTTWIMNLHMAALWGLPWQMFVTLMGIAVAMLSVTGALVWWRKRRAKKHRRPRLA